ncbi:MAG: hypothetical protein SOX97_07050 [Sutterella sp.]|nr:hypothetical protein [Sutterella sp.]
MQERTEFSETVHEYAGIVTEHARVFSKQSAPSLSENPFAEKVLLKTQR